MNILSNQIRKIVSVSLALIILSDALLPKKAFALTSGPDTPEFSSFTPVSENNLVNAFNGSFSYNLPLLNVPGTEGGGYALSLSYDSGVNPEQEASWVGFGWNLSPGAITRQVNGYPDDYKNKPILYFNKTIPNYTLSATEDLKLEAFGVDKNEDNEKIRLGSLGSASISKCLRYNNYSGMTKIFTLGLNSMGAGLSANYDGNEFTYNGSINPLATYHSIKNINKEQKNDIEKNFWKRTRNKIESKVKFGASQFAISQLLSGPTPNIMHPTKGRVVKWSGSAQANPFVPVGVELGFSSTVSQIETTQSHSKYASGYFYPSEKDAAINDYYKEKDFPFSERSTTVGIPLNNADQFLVTGENLGGGFRGFHSKNIVYHPNYIESRTDIHNIGIELAFGTNFGIGADLGVGKQITNCGSWSDYIIPDYPENPIYCFNNDLASVIDFSNGSLNASTKPETAILQRSQSINLPGFKGFKPEFKNYGLTNDISRSSYIESNKYNDTIKKFNKQTRIEKLKTKLNEQDLIGEYQIVNTNGNIYQYGLPVLVKNEVEMQVDIQNGTKVHKNYLVTKNIDESTIYSSPNEFLNTTKVAIGEKRSTPYAQSFLLTQITTPDYIDVNKNGPDSEDYGGWTTFDYRKVHGKSAENYYKWRVPYSGLIYHKNEISNPSDNIGSFSMGEKEVFYLKAIETKTHVAFFITNKTKQTELASYFSKDNFPPANYLNGSNKDRYDGLDAGKNPADSLSAKGIKKLEKLERIVLYSKNDFSKPVQTTYFEYDNSLVKNLPNSVGGNFPFAASDSDKSGKLTLKRVWTESEGVMKSKISPYVFSYEYKNNYPSQLISKYPEITNYGLNMPESVQNPDYSPYSLSMWSTNQYNGEERFSKMQPWIYQGDIPNNEFDIAAWHLKCIKLPSGGEIHVQYEENDYCFVQDRRAMAMVSLASYCDKYDKAEYVLNLNDIGNPSKINVNAYVDQLKEHFLGKNNERYGKEKIYFKFLYKLIGVTPNIDDLKSEYISGYATVSDIQLTGPNKDQIKILLECNNKENVFTPRQTCYDFVVNRRGYKLDFLDNTTYYDNSTILTDPSSTHGAMAREIFDFAFDQFFPLGGGPKYKYYDESEIGTEINMQLSYLKIPLPDYYDKGIKKAKRGGAARVKRVLMFDPGIEAGDAALYGSAYYYSLEDGSSSGIATNEPARGKEENALVRLLPLEKQRWLNKLVSGTDKSQYEGPIGESLLPSPSIGYSRVIVENIHTGKTGTGFKINEFYTVKDYPFDYKYSTDDIQGSGVEYTALDDVDNYSKKDKLNLNLGLYTMLIDKKWASQGFRFIVNSMHGQPKSIKSYSGTFILENQFSLASKLISGEDYEYFEPGESISTWDGRELKSNQFPGKQVDIISEVSSISDDATDLNLELDITITLSWLPIPYPTVVPSFNYKHIAYNCFSTSKVIKYPAILKKKRSYGDGVLTETENLVFNPYTGEPLLIKMTDGFDKLLLGENKETHNGSIYNLSIPANFQYKEMGPKSTEASFSNRLNENIATFTTYGVNPLNSHVNLTDLILKNVIKASVVEYKNASYEEGNVIANDYSISASDITELNKKNRLYKEYIYKVTDVLSANGANGKIYNSGYSKNAIPMFDWTNPDESQWLNITTNTLYSPHGQVLEKRDALGIYSSAKYGYSSSLKEGRDRKLPSMIAKNSKYSFIAFHDFETDPLPYDLAHSGNKSKVLKSSNPFPVISISKAQIDNSLIANGCIIKAWVANLNESNQSINLVMNVANTPIAMKKIAQSGKWSLYEGRINGNNFDINQDFNVSLSNLSSDVLIDDVIFHPTYAEVTSYVYDSKSFRLLTSFGSSHFGLFYRYNKEGQLVRKMIETEQGLKTIQETQYHTVTDDRLVQN